MTHCFPSYVLNTSSNTSCKLPVAEYPSSRHTCDYSVTSHHRLAVSSHHRSSLVTYHSRPLTDFRSSSPHQSSPITIQLQLHHRQPQPTTTIIAFTHSTPQPPYHYFPHAGKSSTQCRIVTSPWSPSTPLPALCKSSATQPCLLHQWTSDYSVTHLTSTSLQSDLQHASIHAPSCIVVRESPCSRCFIIHQPVHWEGSTVTAGHQPTHHDEAMLQ